MARPPAGKARKRITIRDVAARAGVDASLVSRVLNDHPKASAGPATRERILEAARSLGYQPNLAARSLRMARTWTLGLMLPNLTNPLYAAIARAAERRARSAASAWSSGLMSKARRRRPSPACCSRAASTACSPPAACWAMPSSAASPMASRGRW